jgi:thioredoxin reductase
MLRSKPPLVRVGTFSAGFVLTGSDLPQEHGKPRGWPLERPPFMFETSMPGVFAAGDVRSGADRRVAAAVGEEFENAAAVQELVDVIQKSIA